MTKNEHGIWADDGKCLVLFCQKCGKESTMSDEVVPCCWIKKGIQVCRDCR